MSVKRPQEQLDLMKTMRFEKKMFLREIGEAFDMSRERVRQLIGNTGHFKKSMFKFICQQCGNEKEITEIKNNLQKKYCSKKCFYHSRWLNSNKPIKEYNTEEIKVYNRKRNEKTKMARHQWYLANKEKRKERNRTPEARAYFSEYAKRPEVVERRKIRIKEK